MNRIPRSEPHHDNWEIVDHPLEPQKEDEIRPASPARVGHMGTDTDSRHTVQEVVPGPLLGQVERHHPSQEPPHSSSLKERTIEPAAPTVAKKDQEIRLSFK